MVPHSRHRQIAVRDAVARRSNINPDGPATSRAISRWMSPSSRTAAAKVAPKLYSPHRGAVWRRESAKNAASEPSAMRAGRIATSMCQFVLFILTWITTFILALIIVPTIHESGHAAACLIRGGALVLVVLLGLRRALQGRAPRLLRRAAPS